MALVASLVGAFGFLAILAGADALGRDYRRDVTLALLIQVVLSAFLTLLLSDALAAARAADSPSEARDAFLGAWPSLVAGATVASALGAVANALVAWRVLHPADRRVAWWVMWIHMGAAVVLGVVLAASGTAAFDAMAGGGALPSGFPSPFLAAVPAVLWAVVYLRAYRAVATDRVWRWTLEDEF